MSQNTALKNKSVPNQTLIETIEESLRIADEGKAARVKASAELTQLEADLRRTLTSARANADKAG